MKRSIRLSVFSVVALVVVVAWGADRVDATCHVSDAWQSRTWSGAHSWREGDYAHDGGIASFNRVGYLGDGNGAVYSSSYFRQNVDSLALRGLEVNGLMARLYDKQIDMVGPAPYFSCTLNNPVTDRGHTIFWPWLDLVLNGDGANALSKSGTGNILMTKAPTNFTNFYVDGGTVVLTNESVDVSSATQPLTVRSGKVLATPPNGATMTLANFASEDGIGTLAVTNAASVSLGSLTLGGGGVLDVDLTNGGKVFEAGRADGTAVDGALVHFGADGSVNFLDYSVANGFAPGSDTPANARVLGSKDDADKTVDATGEVGSKYVYRPAVASGSVTIDVDGSITAPEVTFAYRSRNANRSTLSFANLPTPTSARVNMHGLTSTITLPTQTNPFNSDAVVTVNGADASPLYSSTLNYLLKSGNRDANFKLRLGGSGNGTEAFKVSGGNWDCYRFTKYGETELYADTAIRSEYGTGVRLVFSGPVTGRGGLTVKGGLIDFANAHNTFAGPLVVKSGAMALVAGSGTLGSGDVRLEDGSQLGFSDITSYAATNVFTGTSGDLVVQNAQVDFRHPVKVAKLHLQDKVNRTPAVKLGGDMTATYLIADLDTEIAATDANVTLTTGGGVYPSVIRGDIKDGTGGGTLSLKKVGADTLVVAGTNNTYTGRTIVDAGTLKLGPGLLDGQFSADDIAFWLDASDASTLTLVDGKVSAFASKVGPVKFTQGTAANRPPYLTSDPDKGSDYFNGKPFIRLTYPNHEYLTADRSLPIRTVFVVCRGSGAVGHRQGALLNYGQADVSLRIYGETAGSASLTARRDTNDGMMNTREGKFYHNGTKKDSANLTNLTGANTLAFHIQRKCFHGGSYTHGTDFTIVFGNLSRDFNGDVGEIVAFNRYLSEEEIHTVENYLAAKWNPTELAQNDASKCAHEVRRNYLPAATTLELSAGSVLDLNGCDQTVAALAGDGVVTNSSATAAKLTVTGTSAFRGTVSGNVTLTLPAGDRNLRVRNGATLVLSGTGDASVAVANPEPPTDSLIGWFDAGIPGSVVTNAAGYVTNWYARAGVAGIAVAYQADSNTTRPTFSETGWDGTRPAVLFNDKSKRMTMRSSLNGTVVDAKCGTVFLVSKFHYTGTIYAFNFNGYDTGLRVTPTSNNSSFAFSLFDNPASIGNAGDTVHINGQEVSSSIPTISQPSCVFAFRAGDTHFNRGGSFLTGAMFLGSYSGERAVGQSVAEVIAYSRLLTDAEFAAVERYLMNKWMDHAPLETQAFDSTSSFSAAGCTVDLGDQALAFANLGSGTFRSTGLISVTDGLDLYTANSMLMPATFTGDVAFGNGTDPIPVRVHEYAGMDQTVRQIAVRVDGTATGSLAAVDCPTKLSFRRSGGVWSFAKTGMTILVR